MPLLLARTRDGTTTLRKVKAGNGRELDFPKLRDPHGVFRQAIYAPDLAKLKGRQIGTKEKPINILERAMTVDLKSDPMALQKLGKMWMQGEKSVKSSQPSTPKKTDEYDNRSDDCRPQKRSYGSAKISREIR